MKNKIEKIILDNVNCGEGGGRYVSEDTVDKIMQLITEAIPKEIDLGHKRTEQEPTQNETTYNEGYNDCREDIKKNIL